ncbi:hypothetical protein BKA70DRAFT_1445096 [Coprinopsis sp. MPI-PUGE-AT-0042]|nr:hypothetical protein BKA70DRAFT_1445096 [Coprinopsis sp. MPI-PUGE-AT-0042]
MDPMLVEHAQPVSQGASNIDLNSVPATHGDLEDLHCYTVDLFNGTMQSVEAEVQRVLATYCNEATIPLRQAIGDLQRQVLELQAFKTENTWLSTEVPKLVTQHPLTLKSLEHLTAAHDLIQGRLAEVKSFMDRVNAPKEPLLPLVNEKTAFAYTHRASRLGGALSALAFLNAFLAAILVDKIYFESTYAPFLVAVLLVALAVERTLSASA